MWRLGRGARINAVPWVRRPSDELNGELDQVTEVLDPVLVPLKFARGQTGASQGQAQVIFCRGYWDSTDGGCVDLVIDLAAGSDWRITDVRYWGFPSERWHLDFDRDSTLADQLAGLALSLPSALADID